MQVHLFSISIVLSLLKSKYNLFQRGNFKGDFCSPRLFCCSSLQDSFLIQSFLIEPILLPLRGSCNLIVVQMFGANLPDYIEASCQTVKEWNLVCFACECMKGVDVFGLSGDFQCDQLVGI